MATILIVDDRPPNREFLVTLLGYGGHCLLEAADGVEALDLARAHSPDLIITDILMPTMDGYEFVRQLRADMAVAHIPVIFYTAHYLEQEARTLAEACGVSFILTKPSEPEEVLRTVHLALAQAPPPPAPPPLEEFDRAHLRVLTDKLAQRVQELRAVNDQQAALIDLSLQLGSERNPVRLLESFCHAARAIIGAQHALVGIPDDPGQKLRYLFTSGMETAAAVSLDAMLPHQGVLGTLLTETQPCRRHGLQGDPQAVGLPPQYPAVYSFLGAPIVSPSQIYGWLCLTNKLGHAEFSTEDERLAGILAAQVGRIYESGRLYAEIHHRALALEQEVAERQRRERQLQALFDHAMDAIAIVDHLGALVDANPATCALLGLPKTALLGRRVADFVAPDGDVDQVWRTLQAQGHLSGDIHVRRPDRTVRDVEYEATANFLPGQHLFIMRDVTERKRLEASLLQAQKMDAIGRLAGGVAHDFNNMLTVITGYSEVLLNDLHPAHPWRDTVEEIKKAAERSATLTRQLLAFSRKQILRPVVLDLNTVVQGMDKMLRRLIGEDITLITKLDPALGQVQVDPGQTEHVIMNLVVNARAAMPTGGTLVLETASVDFHAAARAYPDMSPGAYVMLAVSDSGHGMDADTKSHIFEPFFTTKEVGQGTGLGLATVYGVVKQSGGHISVYSEPGQGTTFKIYLPRVDATPTSHTPPTPAESPAGTETVLLVEDEEAVRGLARHTLHKGGYTVLEARQGDEAVALCEQYAGTIHILVTDVVMPGMSGPQLAERLARLRPGMKVLYISGYTESAVIHRGILAVETAFLPKPFSPQALAWKVREVLDSPTE
jgi:PAS domain S-box-containing protein